MIFFSSQLSRRTPNLSAITCSIPEELESFAVNVEFLQKQGMHRDINLSRFKCCTLLHVKLYIALCIRFI